MHNICYFEIPTTDVEVSKKFYADTFGWKMIYDPETGNTMFETPEGPRGGFEKVDYVGVGAVIVYIKVASIEEAMRRVTANGGSEVKSKTSLGRLGWYAIFRDPCNVKMGLWEPAEKEEAAKEETAGVRVTVRAPRVKAKKPVAKKPVKKVPAKTKAKAAKKGPAKKGTGVKKKAAAKKSAGRGKK